MPTIPYPAASQWQVWRHLLGYIARGKRLLQPLRRWITKPNQTWKWFLDTCDFVYEHAEEDHWKVYHPIPANSRTRRSRRRYTTGNLIPYPPNASTALPVTMQKLRDGSFTIASSPQLLPTCHVEAKSLWDPDSVPLPFKDTPIFYQKLLNTLITQAACEELAEEAKNGTLVACNDGAHDKQLSLASHGWVFASSLLESPITTGAGPVDGNPSLLSSYRAELSGILGTLYIISRVCLYYNVTQGNFKLYCNNKGALKNAFSPIPSGITPYLQTDHNLMELICSTLAVMPFIVSHEWVKGHYTGKKKELKHHLNYHADDLAGSFQKNQTPHYTTRIPLRPPDYRVRLIHDGSVVTSKLSTLLVTARHNKDFEDHIIKKTQWTKHIFQMVHWDGHEQAFIRLPQFQHHSTDKVVHSLLNTNCQNHLYYGAPNTCPICDQLEETMSHVLTYSHKMAVTCQDVTLKTLETTLKNSYTPVPVIDYRVWHKGLDQNPRAR